MVASILGAAFGSIGFAALFVILLRRGAGQSALWSFLLFVIGNTLATSVFGAAAFAQPAIGRMYLAGQTAQAMALQDDIYGTPLFAVAVPGYCFADQRLRHTAVRPTRRRSTPDVEPLRDVRDL